MNTQFGKEIVDNLEELADALEKKEIISEKFTCHKVALNLIPTTYTPEMVKETREILSVSQALFAQFLDVSVKTVQAWEQGDNPVSGPACRLMDEIRENPEYWCNRIMELAVSKTS